MKSLQLDFRLVVLSVDGELTIDRKS